MRAILCIGCLALFGWSATAQESGTAATITEGGRGLQRALDVLLPGKAGEERTLILLIDSTPSLQQAGFADTLAAALQRHAAALATTRLGVARVGADRPLVLSPTEDLAAVTAAVRQLLAAPSKSFQNVYADVRAIAGTLANKSGMREILLVTFDNGDAEDDLEGTVSRIERAQVRLHVLTSEAYLADSYWASRPYERGPKGCRLTGGDAPLVDMPWGWLFQVTVANEVTPSGYGTYGLNRLAATTGGRVFLYTPPDATGHRCAVYGGCLFCSGDHIAESEVYWDPRLRLLAPSTKARREASGELADDPWFRATLKAWRDAAQAGLVLGTPPRLAGATVTSQQSRPGRVAPLMVSMNMERNADRAEKAARECERILAALDADLARIDPTKGSPRHRAGADFTRLMLQLTKVNLVTFAGWCREIAPKWMAKDYQPPPPPEADPLYREDRAVGIGYTNYCLCHGVRPFFEVELPGGPALREELQRLDGMAVKYFEQHGHTPFTVALHRQGIARFHLTYPGIAGTIDRQRPKSKTAQDPVTVTEGKGRPARTGTTGGAGPTGPTTGGGR